VSSTTPIPPQPDASRLTAFAGHPAVVGIVPKQPELVMLTAVAWSHAVGDAKLVFAYADPRRYVVEEHADGSVEHTALDPDDADGIWRDRCARMEAHLHRVVDPTGVPWEFQYLAGRQDRALTHLARAVDAGVIIVGTRAPGLRHGARGLLAGSTEVLLSHHQHRPVLVVPLTVVDWKTQLSWG